MVYNGETHRPDKQKAEVKITPKLSDRFFSTSELQMWTNIIG